MHAISFCPECGSQGGYLRGACVCCLAPMSGAEGVGRLRPCTVCRRIALYGDMCWACLLVCCPRCAYQPPADDGIGNGCPACGLRPCDPMLELWPYEDRPLEQ